MQDRISRKLLDASKGLQCDAILGGEGWKRREEKKVLFGRRMEEHNKERLVKWIVENLQEARGVGRREEYEVLRRKYGLEQEDEGQAGSEAEWKRGVREQNGNEWKEE